MHDVRTAPRKGFSDDPIVKRERVQFAQEVITWDRTRLYNQIFSDEVWAMGGAHTVQYVTVKADGSESFLPETVTQLRPCKLILTIFGCKTARVLPSL